MKIRVTLMTENDKHLNESYTNEQIEEEAVKAWKLVSDMLSVNGESMRVEKCELIER